MSPVVKTNVFFIVNLEHCFFVYFLLFIFGVFIYNITNIPITVNRVPIVMTVRVLVSVPALGKTVTVGLGVLVGVGVRVFEGVGEMVGVGVSDGMGVSVGMGVSLGTPGIGVSAGSPGGLVGAGMLVGVGTAGGVVGAGPELPPMFKVKGVKGQTTISLESEALLMLVSASDPAVQSKEMVVVPEALAVRLKEAKGVSEEDFLA